MRLAIRGVAMLALATAAACSCHTDPVSDLPAITDIKLFPESLALPLGTALTVSAQGITADDQAVEIPEMTWWVSAPQIATVEANQTVAQLHGAALGETTLFASARGITVQRQVLVTAPVPVSLEVSPAAPQLVPRAPVRLHATAAMSNGGFVDVTALANWQSSDPAIAAFNTVAAGGVLPLRPGEVTLSASWGQLKAETLALVHDEAPTSLELFPSSATIPLGGQQEFHAVAGFADGSQVDVTGACGWGWPNGLTWQAQDGGLLVRPDDAGAHEVRCLWGTKTARSRLVVTSSPLVGLEIEPPQLELVAGTIGVLSAVAVFEDGTRGEVTQQASWSVEPHTVAWTGRVPGGIEAVADGRAQATAEFQGQRASAEIVVSDAALVSLAIDPPVASLPVGAALQLHAIGTLSDGATQDLTGQVQWTVEPVGNASMSVLPGSEGRLVGVTPGPTTVRATLGTLSAQASVTVDGSALESLRIGPSSVSLPVETPLQLRAWGTFSDGSTLELTDQVEWSTSASASISVSNLGSGRGVLVGHAAGAAQVVATFRGKSAIAQVTVFNSLVSLALAPSDPVMVAHSELRLTATGTFADGSTQDLTSAASYSVADPAIGSVGNLDSRRGVVAARAAGVTTLRATVAGVRAETSLTVLSSQAVALIVAPNPVQLDYGSEVQLFAIASLEDGTSLDVTDSAAWTSSDPAVAEVTTGVGSRGRVRGMGGGRATVGAAYGSLSATVEVAVNPPKAIALEIRPSLLALPAGRRAPLAALATFEDGTSADLTRSATWWSTTANASVSPGGEVFGRALGSSVVHASARGLEATCQVAVTDPIPVGLTLSPSAPVVPLGARQRMTTRAFLSDGSNQDVSDLAALTSADPSLISIEMSDAIGLAQGGPVTLTSTYMGLIALARANVGAPVVTRVELNPNAISVFRGQTATVAAMAFYSDGSSRDISQSAIWKTSDANVCNVAAGSISGVQTGAATVSASFAGFEGSASVTVIAAELQRMAIVPARPVLETGLLIPLRAYGVYSDGTSQDLTASATWISVNPSIAGGSYSRGGYYAVGVGGVGSTRLSATVGTATGQTDIEVIGASGDFWELSPTRLVIPVNVPTRLFQVLGRLPSRRTMPIMDAMPMSSNLAYSWNAEVFIGKQAGTGTLAGGAVELTITDATLSSIKVIAPSRLPVGAGMPLQASGTFSDGSTHDITLGCAWWSTDVSKMATVFTNSAASASALAPGKVEVGCSFAGINSSTPVTIADVALSSLDLQVPSQVPAGTSIRPTVIGTYADGSQVDLTDGAIITSSAPDIAFTRPGIFEREWTRWLYFWQPGQVTLQAEAGGKRVRKPITVTSAGLVGIDVSLDGQPPSPVITLSGPGPFRLHAIGRFSDGSTAEVTSLATFSPGSRAPGVVATISNGDRGAVTVLGSGTQAIEVIYPPTVIGQAPGSGTATLVIP